MEQEVGVVRLQAFDQKIQGCQDRSILRLLKALVWEAQRKDQNFELVFTLIVEQQAKCYIVDQIFAL